MGCASSKRIDAAVDVYRPAPASFSVFDINAIEEPWLKGAKDESQEHKEKPTHLPAPILAKLNEFESDVPHSWDEVSRALENLKPAIRNDNKSITVAATSPPKPAPVAANAIDLKQTPRKSPSFHTLEEFDGKLAPKPQNQLRKTESLRNDIKTPTETAGNPTESSEKSELSSRADSGTRIEGNGYKPVKENIFILRDKMEKEKEGKQAVIDRLKRNPLSDFPEKCPPGGAGSVVVYTTSLRGVRRTYEDCCRARSIFEIHQVVTDERDVSLHGGFLNELRELLDGEGCSVPRVFVKGRYIGGVEELSELNDSGKLGRLLSRARIETGLGKQGCDGCGGARFVPCLDCGGSCKVVRESGVRERCGQCNENGLVRCPACL